MSSWVEAAKSCEDDTKKNCPSCSIPLRIRSPSRRGITNPRNVTAPIAGMR